MINYLSPLSLTCRDKAASAAAGGSPKSGNEVNRSQSLKDQKGVRQVDSSLLQPNNHPCHNFVYLSVHMGCGERLLQALFKLGSGKERDCITQKFIIQRYLHSGSYERKDKGILPPLSLPSYFHFALSPFSGQRHRVLLLPACGVRAWANCSVR